MGLRKICALLLALLLVLPMTVSAASPTEIYTAQDLQGIADDPDGSYILMADIDMAGIPWESFAFSGTLDGNGYAILNLTVGDTGSPVETTYDGNHKPYDTRFAGLFATAVDAKIQNLTLLGLRVSVTTDEPCFVGGIAGYSRGSTISDCVIQGTLELRAHDRIIGVGGVIGYGNGSISDCSLDVTLICTDTGKDTMEEAFLGGVCAAGFPDITGCEIHLAGFHSEYGYCHDGGIAGMYMPEKAEADRKGRITHNRVTGAITFFECNQDRRAYCKAEVGEYVATYYAVGYNTTDFTRDERKEYDRELRPEMCQDPAYTTQTMVGGCQNYGFTRYTCTGCGYSYTGGYTPRCHSYGSWQVVKAATAQKPGRSRAECTLCGAEAFRTDAPLAPEETTQAPGETTLVPDTSAEITVPAPTPTEPAADSPEKGRLPWGILAACLGLAAMGLLAARRLRMQKKRRRRRRRPPTRP